LVAEGDDKFVGLAQILAEISPAFTSATLVALASDFVCDELNYRQLRRQ
jgi:hypothetical protein